MGEPKSFYGNMFPDLDRLENNCPLQGHAFTVLVESMGMGVSGRAITVNADRWKTCVACEHYRDCYDLSMAKLLSTHVVDSRLRSVRCVSSWQSRRPCRMKTVRG